MKGLTLILLVLATFYSCQNSDEENNFLSGEWNLIRVSCECEPVILQPGDQIWTFDLNRNTLHVTNNVTESLHTILETGTYDIVFTSNTVTIQQVEYDYYFENEKLYLSDHPEADGPLIEFVR